MPKVVVYNYHSDMPWTHTALELVDDVGESHYYSLYPITHKEMPKPLCGQEEDELSGKLLELWQRYISPALGPIEGCFESKSAEADFPADTKALELSDDEFVSLKLACDTMKAQVESGVRKYASIPRWGNNCGDFVREALWRGLKHRPGADEALALRGTQQAVFLPNLFYDSWVKFVDAGDEFAVKPVALQPASSEIKSYATELPKWSLGSGSIAAASWRMLEPAVETVSHVVLPQLVRLPKVPATGVALATVSSALFARRTVQSAVDKIQSFAQAPVARP